MNIYVINTSSVGFVNLAGDDQNLISCHHPITKQYHLTKLTERGIVKQNYPLISFLPFDNAVKA
jgi:hypothetical protein